MSESKSRAKKNIKINVEDRSKMSNEDEMIDFAEVLTENILEKDLTHMDSFELYAHQLRTHLHVNQEAFKHRFSNGYHILIEELDKP